MTDIASLERRELRFHETNVTSDDLFGLGMKYSIGCGDRSDLVMAHMYFNLAGIKGHQQAPDRRSEVAAEMSGADIATAQRAARIWLDAH